MATRDADEATSEQATSSIVEIEIDDSDTDSGSPKRTRLSTRPKLSTRKAVADSLASYGIVDDDDDDDSNDDDDDDNDADGDESGSAPAEPSKRKRALRDDDEYEPLTEAQMEEEEVVDDAEELVDEESATDDVDDSSRRRSSRARKAPPAFGGIVDDDEFEDYRLEYFTKPRRERQRTSRKAPSKSRSSRKVPSRSSRSKKKAAASSASESETDDEFFATDDDDDDGRKSKSNARGGGRTNAKGNANSCHDSDDDNMFLIDKVIAREVHTRKEWTRICANKNTRFLTNMSIFLADDDGDDEDDVVDVTDDNKSSTKDDKSDASDATATGDDAATKSNDAAGTATDLTASEPVASPSQSAIAAATAPPSEQNNDADASASSAATTTAAAAPATPVRAPITTTATASTPLNIREVSQTEERFLVKWKGLSYLHVSWETEAQLLEVDKNAKGKIQRFRDKELMGFYTSTSSYGDEYFSPEFRLVDRILDIQDHPGDAFSPEDSDDESEGQPHKYFYVKWKSLSYDELTWERDDDVNDDAAVAVYEDRLMRVAARHRRVALAPPGSSSTAKHRKIHFRGYSAAKPPPFRENQQFELRDYQLTGVNWILFNWYQNRNSLLADEMGLGKTVQTVTYINHLAAVEELAGPYLIIAPLSTLGHWQREFLTWTHLDAVVYHGSATGRKKIQEREFYVSNAEYARADALLAARKTTTARPNKSAATATATVVAKAKRSQYRFDVLITTPEMCGTPDFAALARVQWQVLVVDEAHRLKNKTSKFSSMIHRSLKFDKILLLTGTPLQNNVEELWTLLNFLDGDRFGSMDEFLERFGDLKDMSQVEQLHSELKPFLLRRMKEDVEKSLAPKEETIVEVELTVLQKQYYRAIYEQNTEFLARGRKKAQTPSLMNVAMELRKCCNHPFLIKGVEEQEIIRLQQVQLQQQQKSSSDAVDPAVLTQHIRELLVTSSGKLVLLDKLLPRLKENGHRVLIFSQFKIMLDILQDYLHLRAYNCERIDGNITGNDRQAAIDRYCAPNSPSFIMLLSTRAGGVGINLTAADTVIIYDSDWNPQNDLQAQARCHRIGQKKSVKIYRLLTSKTYELHMFHQASLKLGLDQAVLGGIRSKEPTAGGLLASSAASASKSRVSAPSREEIEHLLKHGAYEIFKEEKDGDAEAASKRFSEESIDQILSRSTKIVHDPKAGGDDDGKKSLMSSFSKATFVSSANPDEQVALDDPDFWTKVIGLQEVPDKPIEPSPLKKRRRQPVKSYLIDDSDNEQHSRRGFGKKPMPQVDNDEFVISSDASSDDSDSDDDLTGDDADFSRERKRQRAAEKQLRAATPPIASAVEAIADMLATFGYGRWDEMLDAHRYLKTYNLDELKAFTQHYIVYLLHVGAGTAIVYTVPQSNGELPEPLSPTRKLVMIDAAADRLSVSATVLQDLGVKRASLVQLPKSLRLKPTSIKAQRDANARLQQIDRMFLVQQIIRAKIGQPSPMVSLINELQQLSREQVREILQTGTLPEPEELAKLVKGDTTAEAMDVEQDAANTAKVEEGEGTTAGAAQEASAQATKKEPVAAASDTSESATTDTPATVLEPDAASISETDAADATTMDGTEATVKDDAAPKVELPATNASSTTAATSTAATVDPSSITPTPAEATAQSASDLRQAREERAEALRRLRELPDIGSPGLVAPWWISVLDDVILLFYIYKDGWFKGRMLPQQLLQQSSLFGSRAAPHDPSIWPTVASLTRRVKVVVTTWTNPRRLRQQSQMVAPRPVAPPPPQPPAAPMHAQTTHSHAAASAAAAVARGLHQPPPALFNSSRHNRFAKIVFAFGIPDTRTCRDDTERLEKWRYFLQDELLGVASQPLVELLGEALDLERCCRLRVQHPGANPTELAARTASSGSSILGGMRGYWLLTTTQCRRLLQRVDLFRLLRTQILVLPPTQLVDVVGRVVSLLRVDPSKNEFPRWWSSPRHDILLLQGIECYGLDEYLGHVWQLPLFAQSNSTGSFPNTTWAENYVAALALRCRRVLNGTTSRESVGSASVSESDARQQTPAASNNRASGSMNSNSRKRKANSSPKGEAMEVRQRIRDIQGMRDEDPYFVPGVRVRQLGDSKQMYALAATARRTTAAMKSEAGDSTVASATDTKPDAATMAHNAHNAKSASAKCQKTSVSSSDVEMDGADLVGVSSPAAASPAREPDESTTATALRGRQQSIQAAMKKQQQPARSGRERTPAPRMPRTSGPTLRTRAPRAWDVIVIDESDDDE